MALTPEDIEARQFTIVDRGYLCGEVDRFLAEVAASYRYAMHHLLPGVAPLEGDRTPHEAASLVAERNAESFGRLGEQVTEVLRSTEELAASLRAEAEVEVGAIRAQAEGEAAEMKRAAELDREQAKEVLIRAEDQAERIIREAEHRSEARLRDAESAAQARAEQVLDRARSRAEQILGAEKAAIERLQAARAALEVTLERLSADSGRPVLDLTDRQPVLRVRNHPAARDTDLSSGQNINGSATSEETVTEGSGGDAELDPVARMVRAAVGRAAQHSAPAGRAEPTRGPGIAGEGPGPTV